MALQLERRLFTTDEYDAMIQVGILTEDDRVELIRGEIVKMPSAGPAHAACVARLTIVFSELLGRRVVPWAQNPVRLPNNSQPEPDMALLKPRSDFYAGKLPAPEDILLAIEVSDTTIETDRKVKIPLYAQSGIAEAWIIDLVGDVVEVYSSLAADSYQQVRRMGRGETMTVPGFPNVSLTVEEILA